MWIKGYLRGLLSPTNRRAFIESGTATTTTALSETQHIFIAVCDHFEPEWGKPDKQESLNRVHRWRDEYPQLFEQFRDSSGRPPQHSFFFPQDEYAPEYLDCLATLCEAGFGDVDVHLHHDHDTAEGLTEKLVEFRDTLFHRHGLLRRDPDSGEIKYGFIHGNWALCNSRPDGRWCGVDNEIDILRETGCYADFTMPSAPSDTQTSIINSIYYATNRPGERKSHNCGQLATVGETSPTESLLMIQGPLTLDWSRRKWGLFPKIENSDIHAGRPAAIHRLDQWLHAGVQVAGQPNWTFIKLHTHGCKDGNIDTWLGPEMQTFHANLADWAAARDSVKYHYVTAYEMANLVHQAESGQTEPTIGQVSNKKTAIVT